MPDKTKKKTAPAKPEKPVEMPSVKALDAAMAIKPYSTPNVECTPWILTLTQALKAKALYAELAPNRKGKSQQSWLRFLQQSYDGKVASKEVAGEKPATKKAPASKRRLSKVLKQVFDAVDGTVHKTAAKKTRTTLKDEARKIAEAERERKRSGKKAKAIPQEEPMPTRPAPAPEPTIDSAAVS